MSNVIANPTRIPDEVWVTLSTEERARHIRDHEAMEREWNWEAHDPEPLVVHKDANGDGWIEYNKPAPRRQPAKRAARQQRTAPIMAFHRIHRAARQGSRTAARQNSQRAASRSEGGGSDGDGPASSDPDSTSSTSPHFPSGRSGPACRHGGSDLLTPPAGGAE